MLLALRSAVEPAAAYQTIGKRTATVVEKTTTNTITATLPAGTAVGDTSVVFFCQDGVTGFVGPSGWTPFFTPFATGASTLGMAGYYRRWLTGETPAAPTASWTTASRATAVMQSYTNVDATTPADATAQTTNRNGVATTSITMTLSTVTPGALVIGGAGADSNPTNDTLTIPAEMSLVGKSSNTTGEVGRSLAVGDETRSAAGAGNRVFSHSATTLTMNAWEVALRPAAVVPTQLTEPAWTNNSGGTSARNGTTSRSIPFGFTATAGRELVVIVAGSVTNTVSGWTERLQPLGSGELSVFTKTAAGGETSISVTNNGSNYPEAYEVYELPSGSTWINGTSISDANDTFPTLTGLPGSTGVIVFSAYSRVASSATQTFSAVWGGSFVEDQDSIIVGTPTDGTAFTIAHQLNVTGTSITPTITPTTNISAAVSRQKVVFAYSVPLGPSAPVIDGAVTLTSSATLTSDGVRTTSGAVSLTSTSTLTSAPTVNMVGAVSLTASSSLVSDGVRTTSGAINLTATPTLVAQPFLTKNNPTVSLTALGSLTSDGTTIGVNTVSLVVTSVLSSQPFLDKRNATIFLFTAHSLSVAESQTLAGAVSLAATAGLTSQGIRTTTGTLTLTSTSALSVSVLLVAPGAVSMAASSTLAVTASGAGGGAVSLIALGTLLTSAQLPSGTVSLLSTAVMITNAFVGVSGAVSLVSSASLTAAAIRFAVSSVSLLASTTLLSSSYITTNGSLTLNATGILSVSAVGAGGSALLTTSQSLLVAGFNLAYGTVSLIANGSLTSSSLRITSANVTLAIGTTLSISGTLSTTGSVSLVGTGVLSLVLGGVVGNVSLVVGKTLSVSGVLGAAGSLNLNSTTSLLVNGIRQTIASISLTATPLLVTTGLIGILQGTSSLTAFSTLSAGGVRVTNAIVVPLVAIGTLVVNGISGGVGGTTLNASTNLGVSGVRVVFGTTQLNALPILSVLGRLGALGEVPLTGNASLVVGIGVISQLGAVLLTASGVLTANGARIAVGSVSLVGLGRLLFIEVFPEVDFRVGGVWLTGGIHTDSHQSATRKTVGWTGSGTGLKVGAVRTPVNGSGWTTAGIRAVPIP